MYEEYTNEKPTTLNSLVSRSHSYIRLLIEKSMDDGVKYFYHNGRRLSAIEQPERIVSQIFPYFLRLVFLEISNFYGTEFKGLKFHANKRASGSLHFEASIVESEITNQLEYFSFLSYVFNYVFLKNKFYQDLTVLTKTSKFI